MSNLCNRCGICCKLIPVNPEDGKLLRDGIQLLDEEFAEMLIPQSLEEAQSINEFYVQNVLNTFPLAEFYRCKFLSPTNECTKLAIPEFCQKYPSDPFAFIPEDCGYCGELFLKNEEIKQRVRKYKEEIVYYQAYINEDPKQEMVYQKIIHSLEKFINKYSVYGAEEW